MLATARYLTLPQLKRIVSVRSLNGKEGGSERQRRGAVKTSPPRSRSTAPVQLTKMLHDMSQNGRVLVPSLSLARVCVALARFVNRQWLHGRSRERDVAFASGSGERRRRAARVALPAARARADAPARDRAHALEDLPRRGGGAWRDEREPAPIRRRRVRALSRLRHPRARVCAGALRRVRRRAAGRLLVQGAWLLPVMHQPAHARHRGSSRRSGDPTGAGASVGVVAAAVGALSACPRP